MQFGNNKTQYGEDITNNIIQNYQEHKVVSLRINTLKTTKEEILNILTKYCVFTAENMLLVMRPYQIVATERISVAKKVCTIN